MAQSSALGGAWRELRELSSGIVGLLAIALFGSCAVPVTRLQVPRTTPAGKLHAALGLSSQQPNSPTAGVSLAMRYGVMERIDLGVALRPAALDIGPKFQLVRGALEVSIAPALLLAYEGDLGVSEQRPHVNVLAARTTAYIGSNLDHLFAVFVAPTLDAGRRSVHALLAPGVLGGVVFSPQQRVHLLLELGFLFPARGPGKLTYGGQTEQLLLGPGDRRLEITAALIFGSYADDASRTPNR